MVKGLHKYSDVRLAKNQRMTEIPCGFDNDLDAYLFFSLAEVREHTGVWMDEYNNRRPQEGLGDLTSAELPKKLRDHQITA